MYNILQSCTIYYNHVHVLMRDEKEGRKKQARSNMYFQVHAIYVCLSGIWLGGLFYLSFFLISLS